MKAISLWQPWASLLASGAKRIETRDWAPQSLRPGQLVAIHAAKHWTADERDLIEEDPFFKRYLTLAQRRGLWSVTMPSARYLGGIIAIARFQGAYPTEQFACAHFREQVSPERAAQVRLWISDHEWAFGNYSAGRYGWLFSEVRPVAIIPATGKQGLFEWDAMPEIANLYREPANRMKENALSLEVGGATEGRGHTPSSSSAAISQCSERTSEAQPLAPTRVVHVRRGDFDPANSNHIYVGRQMPRYPELRASGWGNPFKDGLDTLEGRQSAIDRYRAWILDQPKLLARLPELRGKTLGCWCAPAGGLPGDLYGRVCHGEVLAALADLWCAQCNQIESPEHVREHEAAGKLAPC